MNNLNTLITKLEKVSRKNDDEFEYSIKIDARNINKLTFSFEATETADGHTILAGSGATVEDAALDALGNFEQDMTAFGYKL